MNHGFLIGRSGCDRSDQGQVSLWPVASGQKEMSALYYRKQSARGLLWEVLNGVGVDGVASEEFSPFFRFFFFFFSFFFAFWYSPRGQGEPTAIYCKNGEFHSDPVCTDPVQSVPNLLQEQQHQQAVLVSFPMRRRAQDEHCMFLACFPTSCGASGGSLHGGCKLKVKKAHFAACAFVSLLNGIFMT